MDALFSEKKRYFRKMDVLQKDYDTYRSLIQKEIKENRIGSPAYFYYTHRKAKLHAIYELLTSRAVSNDTYNYYLATRV